MAFWLALIGLPEWRGSVRELLVRAAPDLAAGAVLAAIAARVSLRLLPVGTRRRSLVGSLRLAARFLRSSIVAAVDVAWRALGPHTRVSPGFVLHRTRLTRANDRDAFMAMTSLVPGTIPLGCDAEGVIRYHALDMGAGGASAGGAAIAASLAADEAAFMRALGEAHAGGPAGPGTGALGGAVSGASERGDAARKGRRA